MLQLPDDREVFRLAIRVRPGDIDDLNHVNNVVYLQWVQDVASAHWQAAASDALRKECMWVVLRHEIAYHTPAILGDELTAFTWIDRPAGPRQDRHVVIRRSRDGKELTSARTVWCLLDPKTGRPKRVSAEITFALGLKDG